MKCERCGGPMWLDEDGDASCVVCAECRGTGLCYHCYHATEDGEPCCLCDEQGTPNVCFYCKGTGLAPAAPGDGVAPPDAPTNEENN